MRISRLIALLAVFALNLPAWAQTSGAVLPTETELSNAEVAYLLNALEKRLFGDGEEFFHLQSIAAKLPPIQKVSLYESHKVSGLWGLGNFYFIGSIFQGDPGTSAIMIGGYLGGLAVIGAAVTSLPANQQQTIWIITGAAISGASYLYGLVRPWFYADEQNKKLKAVLFGNEEAL